VDTVEDPLEFGTFRASQRVKVAVTAVPDRLVPVTVITTSCLPEGTTIRTPWPVKSPDSSTGYAGGFACGGSPVAAVVTRTDELAFSPVAVGLKVVAVTLTRHSSAPALE